MCPLAIRQLPDWMLHLNNVNFYICLRKISPKKDSNVFKIQFWKLFTLNDWFKILMNNVFCHNGSVNGCLQLSAHIKCPLLEADLEPSSLIQWLGDNAGLTTQLVEEIVKPYASQCTEHFHISITWDKAAKQATQKYKPHAITTSKTVAPHPEQVPSLLQWVTENKSLAQSDEMIIDDPEHDIVGSSTYLDSVLENTAALPYDNKLELLT